MSVPVTDATQRILVSMARKRMRGAAHAARTAAAAAGCPDASGIQAAYLDDDAKQELLLCFIRRAAQTDDASIAYWRAVGDFLRAAAESDLREVLTGHAIQEHDWRLRADRAVHPGDVADIDYRPALPFELSGQSVKKSDLMTLLNAGALKLSKAISLSALSSTALCEV
jgi:hypothetical protein